MTDVAYDGLADVYDWLVPETLLTPEGTVAAFNGVVESLAPGARVLDCASGIGQLAVGLALQGFDVVATDASPAMVQRTAQLAAAHGVEMPAITCVWEDLTPERVGGSVDAVFCVGNSLTHAPGQGARRAALAAMASVLRPDGSSSSPPATGNANGAAAPVSRSPTNSSNATAAPAS